MSNRYQRRRERARRNEERRRQEAITAMLSRPLDDRIEGPTNPRILGGVSAVRENVPGADFLLGGVLDALEEVGWYGEASPLSIGLGALDILDPTPILGAALIPFKKTAKSQLAAKLKEDAGFGNLFSPEEIDQLVDNFEQAGAAGQQEAPAWQLFDDFKDWYQKGMPGDVEPTYPSLPKDKIGSEVFLGPLGLPPDSPYGTGWGSPNDLKAKKEAAALKAQEEADIVAAMAKGGDEPTFKSPGLENLASNVDAFDVAEMQIAEGEQLQEMFKDPYLMGLIHNTGISPGQFEDNVGDFIDDVVGEKLTYNVLEELDEHEIANMFSNWANDDSASGFLADKTMEEIVATPEHMVDVLIDGEEVAMPMKVVLETGNVDNVVEGDFQKFNDWVNATTGSSATDDLSEFVNKPPTIGGPSEITGKTVDDEFSALSSMVNEYGAESLGLDTPESFEVLSQQGFHNTEDYLKWLSKNDPDKLAEVVDEFKAYFDGDDDFGGYGNSLISSDEFLAYSNLAGPPKATDTPFGGGGPAAAVKAAQGDGLMDYINFEPDNPIEIAKENVYNNYYKGKHGSTSSSDMKGFENDWQNFWKDLSPNAKGVMVEAGPEKQADVFEEYISGNMDIPQINEFLNEIPASTPVYQAMVKETAGEPWQPGKLGFGTSSYGKENTAPILNQILDEYGFGKGGDAAPVPISDPANKAVLDLKQNVLKQNSPLFGYDYGLTGMNKANDDWKQFVQDMTNDGQNWNKFQEYMNMNPSAQSNLFTDWMNEVVPEGKQHFFGSYANDLEPGGFPTIGQGSVEEIELEEVKEPGTYFSPMENLPFFRGDSPAMQEAEWIYDEAERQGLDTSAAARYDRAMEQGFSPEIYIHRTKANEDFSEFDPNRESRGGSYFAMTAQGAEAGSQGGPASPREIPVRVQGPIFGRDPAPEWLLPKRISKEEWAETAEGYNPANKLDRIPEEFQGFAGEISDLFPVISRGMYQEDPFTGDFYLRPTKSKGIVPGSNQPAEAFASPDWSWIESRADVQELIKALGYGSWQVADEARTATGLPSIAVSDPSQIRSTQAMFNPKWKDSGNIMRGLIPPAAAIPILSGYEEDPEEDFFP